MFLVKLKSQRTCPEAGLLPSSCLSDDALREIDLLDVALLNVEESVNKMF